MDIMEPQSFCNANLRGKSFKGEKLRQKDFSNADLKEVNFSDTDLEGANFSGADLTGAKFDNANLKKANFSSAKAGLQVHWKILYLFISFLLVFLAGITSAILANLVGDAISQVPPSPNVQDYLYLSLIYLSLLIFSAMTIFRGIVVSIITIGIITILLITIATFKEILILGKQTDMTFLVIILPLFMAIFLVIIGIEALAFNLMKVVSEEKNKNTIIFLAMFLILVITIIVINSPIFSHTTEKEITAVADKNLIAVFCVAIYQVLLICFVGWKSLEKNKKEWSWAYASAIAIAALKGTSFQEADLTDANFTEAILKNTDFRGAKLTCTRWLSVQGLEEARLDPTSYLQELEVRELVIKKLNKAGQFTNQNFRGQNLREINLEGFNLQDFNFTDADLRQSNLENVNLYNAKLVRTKLDQANLSSACLTGAYIQDWSITKNTRRDGIKCEYIYLQDPTENDRDPHRKPPSNEGNFQESDFHDFISSILDTLELYYNDKDINANIAIMVLKAMSEKYPDIRLKVAAQENSGDHKKSLRLQIIDGEINRENFNTEFRSMYEQTLNLYDPKELMSNNIYNGSMVFQGGEVYAGEIKMNNDYSRTQNLNNQGGTINNSGAGAFSLGDISGTVANTINKLPDSSETDQPSIKKLLTQLKEAIEAESELSDEDKASALGQLEILAEAGKNPTEGGIQKTAKGAMRMLKGLAAELPTATKLVEGVSKLLPTIATLLGMGL